MKKINFGSFLKKLRENKQLSLREVAKRSGVSHPYLSQLENGKTSNPSMEVLKKLAMVYEYPLSDLLETAGYIKTEKAGYKEDFQEVLEEEKALRNQKDILYLLQNKKENVYYNSQILHEKDREKIIKILEIFLGDKYK